MVVKDHFLDLFLNFGWEGGNYKPTNLKLGKSIGSRLPPISWPEISWISTSGDHHRAKTNKS